jgi:hypothetical protein
MGFGSYDESEQDSQELDADLEESDGVSTDESEHDGTIEYEFDATNGELLDKLEEIKDNT